MSKDTGPLPDNVALSHKIIRDLQREVAELKARLNQNSSNSSKPPSVKRAPPKHPTRKNVAGSGDTSSIGGTWCRRRRFATAPLRSRRSRRTSVLCVTPCVSSWNVERCVPVRRRRELAANGVLRSPTQAKSPRQRVIFWAVSQIFWDFFGGEQEHRCSVAVFC